MAVTVRIPTQLRELSGGASEVERRRRRPSPTVLADARGRAPRLRRAALRRAAASCAAS